GLTHVEDGGGCVIPGPVAVVGVDVVLAGKPAARPRVGPAFQLHLKDHGLACLQLDLRPEDAVLWAAPRDDLVLACRQKQLRLSTLIKVHPAAGNAVERTERREE